MTRREFSKMICAAFVLTGLGACGRKNQPAHPEGATYPRDYPYDPNPDRATRAKEAQPAETQPETDQLRLTPTTTFKR